MTATRIPLHSTGARAFMLLAMGVFFCGMTLSPLVALGLAISQGRSPELPVLFVQPLIAFPAFWLTRRASTRIYVTDTGLEIGRRQVPWNDVASFQELGWIGGLLAKLCRLSFHNGTSSLFFYANREGIAEVRRRLELRAKKQGATP